MTLRSIEEIEQLLEGALEPGSRGRLMDRGEAQAIMRRGGELPPDAPALGTAIDADMADYGFVILDAALELRDLDKSHPLVRPAFQHSGRLFEFLVKNGDPQLAARGFYRVIAGASYHLGGYAAMAFALFSSSERDELNLNQIEDALVLLILRNLSELSSISQRWILDGSVTDQAISIRILESDDNREELLGYPITTGVMRALSSFEFALQTGHEASVEHARELLDASLGLAEASGLVSLWWIVRLTRQLLDDLWSVSLHQVVPKEPSGGPQDEYASAREIFIARLFAEDTAQVELWPSQIHAAKRAADPSDDLVVALPTSAGKTRIAELATLTCLAEGKRVLIMTPLRALSAQTERSFQSTFSALGATVSSLYGKSGLSNGDNHALGTDAIVVTTPEKLDFALRSDPNIINDVGLIVLDEGHMIGAEEREIRFEILVQRLLRRSDAADRRIVCLSAILPEGQELQDMTAWIRSDEPGSPVRSEWRPTRQRYGTLEWRNDSAMLRYDLEDNGPFVSRFLTERPAIRPERRSRPRDLKDVTLFSAWRFAEEDKRTLIFVTQANWVEGFGERAVDLVKRGYLPSLLDDESKIQNALTIGSEWLGADHPAVACLKIGVAVHHGRLPSPFLREVERLLSTGAISVTAASPTLAQGLNLNAAVLLTPYLVRAGVPISGEEFANVAGRAGRAFVDTEGLILHVMEDRHAWRKASWKQLVQQVTARSLKSGLVQLITQVILRMNKRGLHRSQDGYEFLANSRDDWLIEPDGDISGPPLEDLIARLDAIIFGLVEALDADSEELPELLDQALEGSLWARQLSQQTDGYLQMQKIVLRTRARLIWNATTPAQRLGHFAMGVGLDTGLRIDELEAELAEALDKADLAALQGDLDALHEGIFELGRHLFSTKPFAPSSDLPDEWPQILKRWLAGESISAIGEEHTGLIEDAFMYRLVWGIEAVRTRRIARGWGPGDIDVQGMAASCLDTGLPQFRMSMLVRAGLPSRSAAKTVVMDLDPAFFDPSDMRQWLRSEQVERVSLDPSWPSATSHPLWSRFRTDYLSKREGRWHKRIFAHANIERPDYSGDICRVTAEEQDAFEVFTPDFQRIARLSYDDAQNVKGLLHAYWGEDGQLKLVQVGPRLNQFE